MKRISSREFNHDTSGAKKATLDGPVFITARGKPAHVLLSYEQYLSLVNEQRGIADLLAMPGSEDVELEVPRWNEVARPADLT
jgi:PHD/YefM family antitoxin component YafN of YafNO toxin-antitoxin module